MSFTKEEIKIAKQTRDVIISEDVEELKAVYMAGEICMWDELQQKQANGDKTKKSVLPIPCVVGSAFEDGEREHYKALQDCCNQLLDAIDVGKIPVRSVAGLRILLNRK